MITIRADLPTGIRNTLTLTVGISKTEQRVLRAFERSKQRHRPLPLYAQGGRSFRSRYRVSWMVAGKFREASLQTFARAIGVGYAALAARVRHFQPGEYRDEFIDITQDLRGREARIASGCIQRSGRKARENP